MKPNSENTSIDFLLNKKLLFVSGKGGVGKTTTAILLGLMSSRQEKKTLIVELDPGEPVSRIFSKNPSGYRETSLLPNLFCINIGYKEAFREYVLRQIRFATLYRAVFENRFVSYFIEATPGLADLMCIGKIHDLCKDYDLVIVDAPATGHSIALLEIPTIVANAVGVGPLKKQADKISRLIQDSENTASVLVTLPEEMPVTELLELHEKFNQQVRISSGAIFINQFVSRLFAKKDDQHIENFLETLPPEEQQTHPLALFLRQQNQSESYFNLIRDTVSAPDIYRLPKISTETFRLEDLEQLLESMETSP